MSSFAMFPALDKLDKDLLGRNCFSNHALRENGKNNGKLPFGARYESAATSGFIKGAYKHGWELERSAAGIVSHFHEGHGRVDRWSAFAEAASVTAAIDDKWINEPWTLPRERSSIQRPVTDNGKHNDSTPKTATTPEIPFNLSRKWGDWKTPHHPPGPQWRPREEDYYPPYQPLSIHYPRPTTDNTPPSPSISPHIRPYDPHQASPHLNIYEPSNPNQPSLPKETHCGKSLEAMEVEAAFILMVIRHQTPEAAAMAISRELRLAQEERQFQRLGSPCGSEDTVVASEFDDGERSGW